MSSETLGTIEQELIATEHARRQAITKGDVDAIDRFLADTFYYAHINGMVEDRAAYLARTRANPNVLVLTAASDISVQIRKGYALLSGKSRIETRDFAVDILFLSVWEPGDDGWKISAYSSTPLPDSSRAG